MVRNEVFAIVSAVFFVALAFILIGTGVKFVQNLVALSLLFGGMSQFLAQTENPAKDRAILAVSIYMAYVGLAFLIGAVLAFILS